MPRRTPYEITQRWTGNDGSGTSTSRFGRQGELAAEGRPTIPTGPSRDFQGEGGNWSPEDLLAGAVSQCQMLWYLHLCSRNDIVVEDYSDRCTAYLEVDKSRGQVTEVTLDAEVTISAGDRELAERLFEKAGELCYVARSLNCPVRHQISVRQA